MDATVTTSTRQAMYWFRDMTTGYEFSSLYHSVRQIPQDHHTNLCPSTLVLNLQKCNFRDTNNN